MCLRPPQPGVIDGGKVKFGFSMKPDLNLDLTYLIETVQVLESFPSRPLENTTKAAFCAKFYQPTVQ